MELKRYLLFMWHNFNPIGGTDDMHGSYDTLEEAVLTMNQVKAEAGDDVGDWSYSIIDMEVRRFV